MDRGRAKSSMSTTAAVGCMKTLLMIFNFIFWVSVSQLVHGSRCPVGTAGPIDTHRKKRKRNMYPLIYMYVNIDKSTFGILY
jgi:hypothetical protein